MGLLSQLFGKQDDPYEHGRSSLWKIFSEKAIFHTETAFGYKVRYELTCWFEKENHQDFKMARMLEERSRLECLDAVIGKVVIPALHARGRFIRLLLSRPYFPDLCREVDAPEGRYVAADVASIELNKELKSSVFRRSGCAITIIDFTLLMQPQADETVEANYQRMIKLHDVSDVKNTPEYGALEEAIMIAAAHRELELRKLIDHQQTNQLHKGNMFAVEARTAGRSLRLEWKVPKSLSPQDRLRGYRREGGFWTGTQPLENNGVCIADSRSDNFCIQHLVAGQEYFYTFVLLRDVAESWEILDSIRFSVRMPTPEEVSQMDDLVASSKAKPPAEAPLGQKTKNALQELMSFVEFDENVSELEKQLVERISGKNYTPEEKAEKIERLRSVVESIRLNST